MNKVTTKPVTLKRVKLIVPTEKNEPAVLAQKAADILGYTGLLVSRNIAGELGKVLLKLDVKPYDISRVNRYKIQKRKEAVSERRKIAGPYVSIRGTWKVVTLSKYTDPIPDFVLSKAIQIKEVCPEVEFFVDSLKVNTKRIPDPFLVAKLGDEKYWIEVWDETNFEESLIDE